MLLQGVGVGWMPGKTSHTGTMIAIDVEESGSLPATPGGSQSFPLRMDDIVSYPFVDPDLAPPQPSRIRNEDAPSPAFYSTPRLANLSQLQKHLCYNL